MSYAPAAQGIRTSTWVSTIGKESQTAGQASVPVSGTMTTDQAYIVRIIVPTATVVRRFYWANGATASTNTVQVGIYNDDLSTFLLGTATTSSGATALQFDNVTDTAIGAGRYWMAIVLNGTTATLQRANNATLRIGDLYIMAAARPLPATLVPATGAGILPLFGFTSVA
jgi:hypothetical protein